MPLERILVMNLNQIGAVVLATPVFRALKQAYPQAHVATLVRDSMVPLLDGNPYLDQVIAWNLRWPLRRRWDVVRALRRQRFDVAINLSHSLERCLLTWLSGAPVRVGFDTTEAPFLQTQRVKEQTGAYHATERNLDLVRALGIEADGEEGFRLYVSEAERRWLDEWSRRVGLPEDATLIGLNPGASNPLNRWSVEAFARLGDLLVERGYQVIVLGGPMDAADGEAIASGMRHPALRGTGQFNLRELSALLTRVAVLVTADTGPMHMAVALRTPVVALFGPADPRWTGPYCGPRTVIQKEELECIRCLKKHCPIDRECLKRITPEEVLAAVEAHVAQRRLAPPGPPEIGGESVAPPGPPEIGGESVARSNNTPPASGGKGGAPR